MKIFVGADHNGFRLRNDLIRYLNSAGHDIEDEGDTVLLAEDDYPIFASKVVQSMRNSNDADSRGILICGSGQGMCIAANRFKGIRACLGYNRESVRTARNDDDCNVLCLPAHVLESSEANIIVETWLNVPFAGAPRFVRRNKELDTLGN
ncbi:MAG: RpiB/LacA/LacB family sugar-phosphate isomerase [Candidatus Saccharibacteria bacterium]